jgi:hypothetical protein
MRALFRTFASFFNNTTSMSHKSLSASNNFLFSKCARSTSLKSTQPSARTPSSTKLVPRIKIMASNTIAHIPSGVYLSPASTTLTRSRSPSLDTEFIDHYAVMGVDNWATSEEIKTAFRRLRGTYFNTDAVKYRALQAAFDVLADRDARRT